MTLADVVRHEADLTDWLSSLEQTHDVPEPAWLVDEDWRIGYEG